MSTWSQNLVSAGSTIKVSSRKQYILWTPSVVLGGLVMVLYAQVMKGLVVQWWQDPNYGHGFLVPVFSLYLLWMMRENWEALPWQPANIGLALMVGAIGMLLIGQLGAELFVSRISFLVMITGIILYFAGWRILRAWSFPLGFLLFMIPLPAIIYYQITFPLQLVASKFAENSLDLLQIPALREGNMIILPNYTLEVAEACSGIRSLFSLLALSVAYSWFVESVPWKRIALVVLMVPISIISNGMRIVGTGILTYFFGPRWAEGFFHTFSGWLIFLTAVSLMFLTQWLLQRIGRKKKESR